MRDRDGDWRGQISLVPTAHGRGHRHNMGEITMAAPLVSHADFGWSAIDLCVASRRIYLRNDTPTLVPLHAPRWRSSLVLHFIARRHTT